VTEDKIEYKINVIIQGELLYFVSNSYNVPVTVIKRFFFGGGGGLFSKRPLGMGGFGGF